MGGGGGGGGKWVEGGEEQMSKNPSGIFIFIGQQRWRNFFSSAFQVFCSVS